jgi:hypothetical protein
VSGQYAFVNAANEIVLAYAVEKTSRKPGLCILCFVNIITAMLVSGSLSRKPPPTNRKCLPDAVAKLFLGLL